MQLPKFFQGDSLTRLAQGAAVGAKQILLKDISSRWGKFSEQELGALKNKDDLVTQIVAKYNIDKAQAQSDVDAVMKGRQI